MARLPLPGADSNVWGDVLNDFLLQAHKPDGSLKNGIVTSSTIAPNSITAAVIEDGAISSTKLSASTGVDGQVLTLNSSQAGGLDWTSPNAGTAALGGDLSGTLGNAQIISGAVTTAKLLDASVTDAKIAGNISQSKISGLTTDLSAKVDASTLGAANGVATLDSGGKVPSSQLPPPASGGESNTASNVGTSGVGIYLQKTGVDLEFKKLRAGSNKVTLTDEIATNTVAVDIDTVNLGLDKTSVGLGNVDNTSDANKPISTATQTVLDTKAALSITITGADSLAGGGDLSANRTLNLVGDTATPGNSRYYGTNASGTRGFHAIPASDPTLGGDLSGTASSAQIGSEVITNAEISPTAAIDQSKISGLSTSLSGKELTIAAGTTSQYWRGDKSWQTLDKTSVGLGNVDNTSDANKPISTATQTVLDTKANTSSLATVAITGSYADLVSKPTIPNIVASATAPVSPAVGDMWVDTSG